MKTLHRVVRSCRRARQARGLTTPALASLASVPIARIRDLEQGKTRAPVLALLDALGRPMGMTLAWAYAKRDGYNPDYDRLTRDRCAEAMCHGCHKVLPMERRENGWYHLLPEDVTISFPCAASKIFDALGEGQL